MKSIETMATGLGVLVLFVALSVPAAWAWKATINVDTGGQPLGTAHCQRCGSGNVSRQDVKYICHKCGHVQESNDIGWRHWLHN
jgi:hypothetical protein